MEFFSFLHQCVWCAKHGLLHKFLAEKMKQKG